MLEVIDLFKSYSVKKGPKVIALDHVSVRFPDRGLVFILGKSGAGKSTFLNVVGGLERPDSGEIRIGGRSSKDFKDADYDAYRNTCLGFVFQEYNLLREYTVRGNLELALALQGEKGKSEEIASALSEVGLAGYEDRRVNELSGGQKQRVAIARALIKNPSIILADEPTGALDSETSLEVLRLLKRLSAGKLVIVVTHDEDFARQFGDRIVSFKDGKIASDETLRQDENPLQNPARLDLRRARLPFPGAARMAFSSCFSKPGKLAVSVLLTTVAFSLLGVAASAGISDEASSGSKALRFTDANYIEAQSVYGRQEKDGSHGNYVLPLSSDDITRLSDESGLHFEGLTSDFDFSFSHNFSVAPQLPVVYYPQYANGLYPSDAIPKDFALVSGQLPESDGEAVITCRQLEAFQHYGYRAFDDQTQKTERIAPEDVSAQSILGRGLQKHDGEKAVYTIVGVLDTHFDASPYESLKSHDDAEKPIVGGYDQSLETALSLRYAESFDGFLYVKRPSAGAYKRNNRFYVDHQATGVFLNNGAGKTVATYDYGHEFDGSAPFFFTNGRSALSKDEALVSDYDLPKFLSADPLALSETVKARFSALVDAGNKLYATYSRPTPFGSAPATVQDLLPKFRRLLTLEFAQSHFSEAVAADFPFVKYGSSEGADSDEKLRIFHGFVWTYCLAPAPTEDAETIAPWRDKFVPFFSSAVTDSLADQAGEVFQGASAELYAAADDNNPINAGLRIVGFYVPTGDFAGGNLDGGSLILSEEDAAIYLPYRFHYFDRAIGYLPQDERTLKTVASAYFEGRSWKGEGERFLYASTALASVSSAQKQNKAYAMIFLAAGGVFLVFATILFANLIVTSIEARKSEIGILRALGARASDVFWIYALEGVFVAGLCTLLSSGATFLVSSLINRSVMTVARPVALFNPSALVVLILFASALLTALVASFIPSYRAARKPPVEAIRSL